uniref:Uncharacterized protein n=1 Tax=viral metagenome TaxID=1070528 RepID=A0A6C0D272_9ZZZZ
MFAFVATKANHKIYMFIIMFAFSQEKANNFAALCID